MNGKVGMSDPGTEDRSQPPTFHLRRAKENPRLCAATASLS
jgi:hypothetical protein